MSKQKIETASFTVPFTYQYLQYLPEGYDADPAKKWPLVVFLHGIGERGTNPATVSRHGPPKMVEAGKTFPFVLISPQCPPGQRWDPTGVDRLVEEMCQKFRIDRDRVYLTGLSMGGYGTWATAQRNPNRYAAVLPICGGGEPRFAGDLKKLPIWVFHGAKDPTVPLSESERMVAAIKQAGGDPKFTIYPEALHDSWTETYANPEVWDWLLAQKKSARTP